MLTLPVSELTAPRRIFRASFLCMLGVALFWFASVTLHWPMMVNAPVMHYVNFLIDHGMRPYSDITDMNMPGAYLLERFGTFLFGAGDLGWRLYDYFLAVVLLVSMIVIARPIDWLAGVYAAGIFVLRHGSEGPWFSGEREEEMAVLLIASCALLFLSVRRRLPMLAAGFGFLAGMAASIKPTLLPFGLIATLILLVTLRRRSIARLRYISYSTGGFLAGISLTLIFLLHHDAWRPFIFVLRRVIPLYASMKNPGGHFLLRYALPPEWLPLLALCLLVFPFRSERDWERLVLGVGAACGLLSYMLQGKGFWYQRYTFLVFAILLICLELLPWAKGRWLRWVGYATLLYGTVYLGPRYMRSLPNLPQRSALTLALETDLQSMGGPRLQHEVQCFDMTFGCLNALYHLKLVENTGFTGDLLLYPQKPNLATDHYRELFWHAEKEHPAKIIVITNQDSYTRLSRWPEFLAYLTHNYVCAVARSFPREDKSDGQASFSPDRAPGYYIYIRRSTEPASCVPCQIEYNCKQRLRNSDDHVTF